jgi:hypothetical protein
MPRYRYVGEVPTVFVDVRTDHGTWVPNPGDEIDLETVVAHPLLVDVASESPTFATPPQPVEPDQEDSTTPDPVPAEADTQEP